MTPHRFCRRCGQLQPADTPPCGDCPDVLGPRVEKALEYVAAAMPAGLDQPNAARLAWLLGYEAGLREARGARR